MRLSDILRLRLRSLLRREQLDLELDEELRYHIERQIEHDIARGIHPNDARRIALLAASGLTQRKEECRDMRGWNLFDNLSQDFRFAIRQLRKNAAFTVTAILMLSLGLCASISIFAFVDAALVKPLPYRQPQRLVGAYASIPLCPQCNLSYLDYRDWKKLNQVFSSIDVYNAQGFMLRTNDSFELVRGAYSTAGFFRTLGVTPILGRDFADGEDRPNGPRNVILSYDSWQGRYTGRRDILGTSITIAGQPTTIIGVLPRDFHFAPVGQPEFWTAIQPVGPCFERRTCHSLFGVARLKDGVSIDTALANARTIAAQLEQQYPDSNRGAGANIIPLTTIILGNVRPILIVLWTAAGLLLLIASVNVAGLLLVRSESRRREVALRSGLGASRARLLSQFLTEGVVLVAAGCVIGLATARWTMQLLNGLIPKDNRPFLPFLQDLGFNPRVLAFAGALALLAAVLFTIIPGSRLAADLREGLSEGARGSACTVWRRLGANMVVLELATAVVLLVGAGLLGKSLSHILSVDLGMLPDHLATMRVATPPAVFNTSDKLVNLGSEVVRRVSALPGVQSAALTSMLPVQGGNTEWIRVIGHPYGGEHNDVAVRRVTPAYFTTLGANLIRGRGFTEADNTSRPRVIVIDQRFVNRYFPGEDPIGKKIALFNSLDTDAMEIVGVVADIREGPLDKATWPTMYYSFAQNPGPFFSLVVRASQNEDAIIPAAAAAIRQISPALSTLEPLSMSDRINHSPAAYIRRSAAWLVGGFAALALLLGIVGLYGVIAYSVGQRTREIGVRIALGAQPGTVYRLILTQAGRLIAIGLVLGLALAVAAAGFMSSLLFGVQRWDAETLCSVAAILAVAGLVASFLPARRAAGVNPVDALRAE